MVRITTLIENNPDLHHQLQNEHGLSLFIEFDGRRLLFDTGQTGALVENAKKLQIDLKTVDGIVISHGHYDHAGGIKKVCHYIKEGTPFLVGEEFFQEKYKVVTKPTELDEISYHYNGIDVTRKEIKASGLLLSCITDDITYLSHNILLFKNFEQVTSFESMQNKFVRNVNGSYETDCFQDELVMGLVTKNGLIVVVGCSHVGIINIIQTIQKRVNMPIYAVIGGTHLVDASEERIDQTIKQFKQRNIQWLAVSHCTGQRAMRKMEEAFSQRFQMNVTGHVMEFVD